MINILSILGCIIPLKVGYHHDFMAGFVLNIFLKQEEFEKKKSSYYSLVILLHKKWFC